MSPGGGRSTRVGKACRAARRGGGVRRELGALEEDRPDLWVLRHGLLCDLDDARRDAGDVDLLALRHRVEAVDVLAAEDVEARLARRVGHVREGEHLVERRAQRLAVRGEHEELLVNREGARKDVALHHGEWQARGVGSGV